jgi:Flp pilus assembly protein TadG
MNRLNGLIKSERGSAIVEFAILAPVLVLLLLGVIEISRYAYYALVASNAARAGAQYGAQNTASALDSSGMQTYATLDEPANSGITATAHYFCLLDGTSTPCPNTGARQSNWVYYIEVDTSGSYNSLFKYPGIPQLVPVSGKAVVRVVNQ